MLLNEFLNLGLGVVISSDFNKRAIYEVLNYKNKYPLIYDHINDLVKYDEFGKILNINYDSTYFDYDKDVYSSVTFDEIMELYKAFLVVILKNFKNDKSHFDLGIVSFSKEYLRKPDTSLIIGPYYNYCAVESISLSTNRNTTEIRKEIYYPLLIDDEYYGHRREDTYAQAFDILEDDKFDNVVSCFEDLIMNYPDSLFQRFSNDELENRLEIINGMECYSYDLYTIYFKDNIIKFYSTERGFDAFGCVRNEIYNVLDDEMREIDTVKDIYKINN